MADKKVMLTEDGYNKLVEKLKYLKEVRRIEVADRLKAAIALGDLSEHSEYDDAKNEQAFVLGRIDDLAYLLSNAKVIDEPVKSGEVGVGTTVVVLEDGEDDPETYMIVGAPEVDLMANKISNESPIGKAVIGHRAGDTVEVTAPAGSYTLKILEVK